MLGQRLQRWPSIDPTLAQSLTFAEIVSLVNRGMLEDYFWGDGQLHPSFSGGLTSPVSPVTLPADAYPMSR